MACPETAQGFFSKNLRREIDTKVRGTMVTPGLTDCFSGLNKSSLFSQVFMQTLQGVCSADGCFIKIRTVFVIIECFGEKISRGHEPMPERALGKDKIVRQWDFQTGQI
jgi:hypothetical protein